MVPVTCGGGLNDIYRTKEGVPNYNPVRTDIIYVCRVIKDIIKNDDKYYIVSDSQKNGLMHYLKNEIKHTFHNLNDFENYLEFGYREGDVEYYSFKIK